MSIVKDVFKHEVQPAMGCTEPIAVAFACSVAMTAVKKKFHPQPVECLGIELRLDPAVIKNGMGVCVPNTNGERGNAIAAALGALCGNPEHNLCLLDAVDGDALVAAKKLTSSGGIIITCVEHWHDLQIEVEVITSHGIGRATIKGNHTNVVDVSVGNGWVVSDPAEDSSGVISEALPYKEFLAAMNISQIMDLVHTMDSSDLDHVRLGINMNLAIANAGKGINGVGANLIQLLDQVQVVKDWQNKANVLAACTAKAKMLVACATDARMAGVNLSVMSSGGSGNQGIVASLVPHVFGRYHKIGDEKILQSIAFSHLLNSYVKCFVGELSPICGCAVAAGLGASAAIVFQQSEDAEIVGMAINNVIGEISGMVCDGAKGSCSLKVVNSTECAIRSACLASKGFCVDANHGIIGGSAEESIQNLAKLSNDGMRSVDSTIISMMVGSYA
ncbi:L-serine ammonia-lyase, iron-sulfur-dependent, subunit alpha [Patescibacteria group bacterium]|nr:L-serine ammonia-lyase, iron-sulfur-dependent, subunit alpha [Patescibacteria group bacterium]